jgi:hypothetical protein
MIFLVEITTPGLGELLLGSICVASWQAAQQNVINKLVEAGVPIHKIAQDASAPTLQVGTSTINIVPIYEFDGKKASTLVALL